MKRVFRDLTCQLSAEFCENYLFMKTVNSERQRDYKRVDFSTIFLPLTLFGAAD